MLQIERVIQEYFSTLFLLLLDYSPFGPLRPLQGYGMQDRGVTVVLGEMDVTRVNPCRFGQGQTPVHTAWFQPRQSQSVTQFRGQCEIGHLPGGRGLPGPNYVGLQGMGDDMWRGENEGSLRNTFQFMRSSTVCGAASKL